MRHVSSSARSALREMFTGAAIRVIAGIVDMGEAFLAKAHNADGGDLVDTGDNNNDFWVHYVDELTGHAGIARLFVPGNILFARPVDNDTVMIVRGRDAHGPGNAYMVHGDAGTADRVPDWATASSDSDVKDGLYTKRVLRLESKDNGIELNVGTANKSITITAGNTKVTIDKDGDVTAIAASGKVVSLGDTSGNTFGEAVYGGSNNLRDWCVSVKDMVNNLRTAMIDTIGDTNNVTVVGEAYAEGLPLPTATGDKSTLQSASPIADPPNPSQYVQNK